MSTPPPPEGPGSGPAVPPSDEPGSESGSATPSSSEPSGPTVPPPATPPSEGFVPPAPSSESVPRPYTVPTPPPAAGAPTPPPGQPNPAPTGQAPYAPTGQAPYAPAAQAPYAPAPYGMPSSAPYAAPSAPGVDGPKQKNGVGLAALIVGVFALVVAAIPFVSFGAWLPAIAAIVLGIIGLVRKNRTRGLALSGLILGAVAMVVAVVVSVFLVFSLANDAAHRISDAASSFPSMPGSGSTEPGTVVLEVTSDTGTVESISYSVSDENNTITKNVDGVPSPWKFDAQVDPGKYGVAYFTVTAQNTDAAGALSCKITYNGKVIAEKKDSGAYAFVICTGAP